jgi:zinc protease
VSPPAVATASPVARARLASGLTVIVRENPAAPVVALTLFVGVGSRHETVESSGVTALLGRVLLKGTRRRSALALAQDAEDAGGSLELATDQEYSELRAIGLARHWPTLVGLLREIVTMPALAAEEIEREREALLGQIQALDDQPFQAASRLLARALYGEHPFGLPPAGEPAVVGRLGRDDLVRHLEAAFVPERMVLAVSGHVPVAEVLREAGRAFGGPAGPGGVPRLSPAPERPVADRAVEVRPTEQTQLLVGLMAPPVSHPDWVALRVLNALLGGGMSSRLFRILRDEAGLAYAVGSFYPTRHECSRLVVHVGTAPPNREAAEAGIRRELARLREEPVPPDELALAKAYLTGALELDLRTNARQSFYLGFFELMGVGHDFLGRYREAIDAVTSDDLARVARRWLDGTAVAVVGPA